jgi:hypothetical protein
MSDSIILLGPIEVDSATGPQCVNDDEPYKNFTDPILGGNMPSSTNPLVGPVSGSGLPTLTGDNVFNVYQSNPGPGSNNRFEDSQRTGSIKFGVTPCAEKIDIQVVGRADIYGSGFDTLTITIDGTQVAFFESITTDPPTPFTPPLDQVTTYNQTVTHNFTEPKVCGHIVEISGASGTVANNNVGYDVKITVTLRTTQI